MTRRALPVFALLLAPTLSRADEQPSPVGVAQAPIGVQASAEASPSPAPAHVSFWDKGEPRNFVATTVDVGYLYLRPRITLGYGKPFKTWIGFDANPIFTSSAIGAYAGIRGQIPWFDLRVGARAFRAFQHDFLLPMTEYKTEDLDSTVGPPSQYVTLETELSGAVPAGPGSVLLVLTGSAVEGVRQAYFVYEETLRAIIKPPYVYRARTGYALRLGDEGNARVGIVGEALHSPGRSNSLFRGGVIASFGISDHFEAVGLLVVPIKSPDSIGIAGGDYGELGLRYRWASGTD